MSSMFWASYAALWLAVVVESVLLLALLREVGHVYLQRAGSTARDGLPIGEELPTVDVSADGPRPLRDLIPHSGVTVLLYVLAGCPVCPEAVAAVAPWTARHSELHAVLLHAGPPRSDYAGLPIAEIDPDVARAQLRLRVAPFALIVDANGRVVAKGLINRDSDVRRLLGEAQHRTPTLRGLDLTTNDVGALAPVAAS